MNRSKETRDLLLVDGPTRYDPRRNEPEGPAGRGASEAKRILHEKEGSKKGDRMVDQ